MKLQIAALIGIFGALSFGGCSSKSSGSADICARAYDVMASRAEQCGSRPPGDKDRYLATCQAQLDLPGSGVTAEWADTCFSAQEKADCGSSDVPECEEQKGDVADGEACSSDIQCASGDCNNVDFADDGTITCGTCDKSKSSSSSSASPTVKEEGETCLVVSETSTKYEDCAEGLYCDTLDTKECKALIANGKACESPSSCESGRCSKGKCADKGDVGDSCEIASGGYSYDCRSGLGCDPDSSKCAAKTYADPGEDCDGILVDCLKGYCDSTSTLDPKTETYVTTGTCSKVLKDGASCDSSNISSQTCDDYARCVGGKCRLLDSLVCVDGAGSGTDDTSSTTTKSAAKSKLKSALGLFSLNR